MRRTIILPAIPALLAIAFFGTIDARAAEPEAGKIRVLILTGGHGFQAEPFYKVFDGIDDIVYEKAEFPAAAGLLKPELADKYDVVVFYDMFQGLTPEQQADFVKLAQRGIGLFPMHHTLGAHQKWPEYRNMIGGKYLLKPETIDGKQVGPSNYAHGVDMNIHVETNDHPITRGLADFVIHDETYGNYSVTSDVKLLLSTDHAKNNRQIAWVKQYGNSRVFYLQLGHDGKAFANPNYIALVARGIRWTAGRPAE